MTEEQLQASIIAEISLRANQCPDYRFIFHVPNGGDRNIVIGKRLKDAGVRAGVPDLVWLLPRGNFRGLVMELKVGKNKPSAVQVTWLQWLANQGYCACIVYDDPAEAMRIFDSYYNGANL